MRRGMACTNLELLSEREAGGSKLPDYRLIEG